MKKYTQKELKNYVRSGLAVDITKAHDTSAINEHIEKIGYSSGTYGINGALFVGVESGMLYAITSRSTSLFMFW